MEGTIQHEKKVCKCGCGEEVNHGRIFINGHQRRGERYWKMQLPPSLRRVIVYNENDVEHLKIYRDADTGQYKVHHYCEQCELDLGWHCYDALEDAVYACEDITWSCMRHIVKNVWITCEMGWAIDEVCGTNLDELLFDESHDNSDKINKIIDAITEKQAEQILNAVEIADDYYDQSYSGWKCKI